MRILVTSVPWTTPIASPPATMIAKAAIQLTSRLTIRSMNRTPSSAITEPTESSIPPTMMTKASAMEKMPNNPTWLAVLERLPTNRKRGLMKATTAPTTRIKTSRLTSFLCKIPLAYTGWLHCVTDGKLEHIVLAEPTAIKKSRYRPFVHDRDAVTHPDDLLHIARDHQDRDAGIGQ